MPALLACAFKGKGRALSMEVVEAVFRHKAGC